MKMILDATCGNRGIWFQKNEPHTIYCDKRTAHYEMDLGDKYPGHRVIDVKPEIGYRLGICNDTVRKRLFVAMRQIAEVVA